MSQPVAVRSSAIRPLGGYDLDRIDLHSDELTSIDLKSTALKEFILANREALIAEAATVG